MRQGSTATAKSRTIIIPLSGSPPAKAPLFASAGHRGRGRKHPFKARNLAERSAINRQINQVLCGVDAMIFALARQLTRNRLAEDDLQELVQKCRIWLWQKSLPKYNAWLNNKPSTFLHLCVRNFINQELRALIRARTSRRTLPLHWVGDDVLRSVAQADVRYDRRVEWMAEQICIYPERFMTAAQAHTLRTVIAHPHLMKQQLAQILGYQRPGSLSTMLRRIKEAIATWPVEEDLPDALTDRGIDLQGLPVDDTADPSGPAC